ncbi:MAG TPA: class I SAM-dependent methyltransferase [Armatimonadota bacterium]|nr:class I SAM-dependent methyltransferase [Armatimonadota bacterium]
MGTPEQVPTWRERLKRLPGLRPAYRALRAAGWKVKDAANDTYWRMRGALPIAPKAKGRVSEVWGESAAGLDAGVEWRTKGWLGVEDILRRYVFPQLAGKDWYHYVAARYCPQPRPLALSLCSGFGHIERDFIKHGICVSAEGVDVSPEAIEVSRRAAEAAGLSDRLSYRVHDVERAHLEPRRYDIIVAWMALHHLRRLEHVFREVRGALKPGGIFVINEYVGPARFQIPQRQVDLVNALLSDLPEDLRRLPEGGLKERFVRPSLREIIGHDPSEAVRSNRILPLLRRCFPALECIEYGGTILNWLLVGISQNFDADNPEHRAALERAYAAERAALASGEFSSDFAFVVARRRSADGIP